MITASTRMTPASSTRYNNSELSFHMGRYRIIPQNIVFEQFHRVIPMHAHSEGCYEIHYIPYGSGTVILDGTEHRLTKDSLFVTGPHISHQQIPQKENPMAEYCIFLQTQEDRRRADSFPSTDPSILSAFLSTPLWIGRDTQNLHLVMQNLFLELARKQAGYTWIVQSMLQLLLSLYMNSAAVMSVITFILVLASYYGNRFLVHGYAMACRYYSDSLYPQDEVLTTAFGIPYLVCLIVGLVGCGYGIIRKRNII